MEKKGVSLCTVITVVLAILKLFKLIDISWVWVFGPIWLPFLVILILILLLWMVETLSNLICKLTYKKENSEEIQDRVNRKVADEIYNGEN